MKTFIVAIYDMCDVKNTIHVVVCANELAAVKQALTENTPRQYRDQNFMDWINALDTETNARQEAMNSDVIVSNVICIG